jgi:UDP-3-O-[3-hydroxymyristoyl] N-acetylglucosamine deacetylase
LISGLMPGRPRRTLAGPTTWLRGIGLHNGKEVAVRVYPSAPHTGRVFREQETGQEIRACAENAKESARCTVLEQGGARLQTVEHLLSALAALGIDDCLIEISGGEVPAVDGSAMPFLSWIDAAGGQPQENVPLEGLELDRTLFVEAEGGICLSALPSEFFQATVLLDYPQPWIGTQSFRFDAKTDDYGSFASARTFGFVEELEWLMSHGLGLGASHENALALSDEGYVGVPRFPDELVRHKLLDLIGDLALVGVPLKAHVIAIKPSHAMNIRLARMLADCVGRP